MELQELLDMIPCLGSIPYEESDESIHSIEDVWERSFKSVRNLICSSIKDKRCAGVGFTLYTPDEKDAGLHSLLLQELVNKGFYVRLQQFFPHSLYGYGSISVDLYPKKSGFGE